MRSTDFLFVLRNINNNIYILLSAHTITNMWWIVKEAYHFWNGIHKFQKRVVRTKFDILVFIAKTNMTFWFLEKFVSLFICVLNVAHLVL